MSKVITLAAASVIALALATPAHAADESYNSETTVEKSDDGSYKSETSTKSENSAGTTTKSEKKVDVEVGTDGDVEKTTTSETKTDPKGLFNSKKVKTKDTLKKKGSKTTKKHKKEVNGDTVEENESTTDTAP